MRRLPSVALPKGGGHAAGTHGQLLLQGWMWLGLQVAALLALLALRAYGHSVC